LLTATINEGGMAEEATQTKTPNTRGRKGKRERSDFRVNGAEQHKKPPRKAT